MDFTEVIKNRESIRNFDPAKPLLREILDRILDAGRIAPSAVNGQPWTFLLISSPEMLEKIRTCYHREWFKDAPHVLVVKGSRKKAWVRTSDGYNSLETDLAIVMDHLVLAAENEGVANCWIAAFNYSQLRQVLGLTEDEEVFAMTPLGYPKADFRKKGNKTRKPRSEIVQYI